MKTRNGFVSNSSSSSFVFGFNNYEKAIWALKAKLLAIPWPEFISLSVRDELVGILIKLIKTEAEVTDPEERFDHWRLSVEDKASLAKFKYEITASASDYDYSLENFLCNYVEFNPALCTEDFFLFKEAGY